MRRLLKIVVALGILSLAVVLSAPWIIRVYIERTHPEVSIRGGVTVFWLEGAVLLEDVRFDSENVWGDLHRVVADSNKNVQVFGGDLNVTLGDSGGGEGSGVKVSGTDLNITLTKGDTHVQAQGVTFDAETVCVKEADVTKAQMRAHVLDGCLKRDRSFATARKVEVPVETSFKIPGVGHALGVELYWVDLNIAAKTIESREVIVAEKDAKALLVLRPSNSLVALRAKLSDETVVADIEDADIRHPWVSPDPNLIFNSVHDVHVTIPMSVLRDKVGEVTLDIGKAHVTVDPFSKAIRGDGGCAAWVDAIPSPSSALLEAKAGLRGDLSFDVKTKPTSFKLNSTCKFQCDKYPIKELKERTFDYLVYGTNSNSMERTSRTTGKGSGKWTSLQDLPPHVGKAFILLEDPGFEKHRGVLPLALENSFKLNLEQGEFMRGGSTITMQLAKNLWLTRSKTITRKAEEALLTYTLESCFSKADILEMYLNVVEFGPNVYGIAEGARYRFHKAPSELSPEEAFYLASILPSPLKALPPEQGGLDKARKIMKMLSKSGYLSEYMLDEGPAPATDEWNLNL